MQASAQIARPRRAHFDPKTLIPVGAIHESPVHATRIQSPPTNHSVGARGCKHLHKSPENISQEKFSHNVDKPEKMW